MDNVSHKLIDRRIGAVFIKLLETIPRDFSNKDMVLCASHLLYHLIRSSLQKDTIGEFERVADLFKEGCVKLLKQDGWK